MADEVQIKVDATRALAKMERVPVEVRNNLRRIIPDLTRQLGSLVNSKLSSELKSRRTLTVAQELHESVNQIYGVVRLNANSPAPQLLPTYLEYGTSAHEIVGNPILSFYWEKLGQQVFFRRVNHPGTKAYAFMSRSFAEMRSEIVAEIKDAVHAGARNV